MYVCMYTISRHMSATLTILKTLLNLAIESDLERKKKKEMAGIASTYLEFLSWYTYTLYIIGGIQTPCDPLEKTTYTYIGVSLGLDSTSSIR